MARSLKIKRSVPPGGPRQTGHPTRTGPSSRFPFLPWIFHRTEPEKREFVVSYLDPIKKQLEESMPLSHGWLRTLAWFCFLTLMIIGIYTIPFLARDGHEPVAGLIAWVVIMAIGYLVLVIMAWLFVTDLARGGFPLVWKNFSAPVRSYWRRNVKGYRLRLVDFGEQGIVASVYRKGESPVDEHSANEVCVSLGGRIHEYNETRIRGVKVAWDEVAFAGTYGGEVLLRVRFLRNVKWHHLDVPATTYFQLLRKFDPMKNPPEHGTNIPWAEIVPTLFEGWQSASLRAESSQELWTKEQETTAQLRGNLQTINKIWGVDQSRLHELTSLHAVLLRRLAQTSRWQHSREGQRIRKESLVQFLQLLGETHPLYPEFRANLDNLQQKERQRISAPLAQ